MKMMQLREVTFYLQKKSRVPGTLPMMKYYKVLRL